MPNWCENRLEVFGKPTDIKKFLDMGIEPEKKVWRMSKYLMMPEKLNNTISPTPDDKVEWCNHWEVTHANKMIEDQPEKIKNLENKLGLAETEDEKHFINLLIEDAKKPITVPELIPCENNSELKRMLLFAEFGADNWYDWCVNNWGTKWDATCDNLDDVNPDEGYICINFDTAWSPPLKWLHNLIKLFPELNFKLIYMELGMNFAGIAFNMGGEIFFEEGSPLAGEDEDDYPHNPFLDYETPWEQ